MKDLNIVARVPLKDLKIKEPKVGIRTPQVLCTSDYQGFLRGDILDANSVYSLVEDLHVPDVEEINKRLNGVAYQDKSNTFAEENIFNKKVTFNSDTELNGPMYINAPNASLIFSGDTARLENVKGIKGVSGDVSNTKVFNTNGGVVDTSEFFKVDSNPHSSPETIQYLYGTKNTREGIYIRNYYGGSNIAGIEIKSDNYLSRLTANRGFYIENTSTKNFLHISEKGVIFATRSEKDIPSCLASTIHIGDTDDTTSYTQVAPITNGKIPSRYINDTNLVKLTDGKIDSNYLPASIVDSDKLNNTVQRLFINGGDGQYLRTESIADADKYYATDGTIQSITDKIDEAIENKVDMYGGLADELTVTSQLVVTSSTATQGGEVGGGPEEGITITPTGIIIDTDYDNDDGIFLTNGKIGSLTDKIAEYMTAHPSSSSSDVGLSYNNTFTGEINTFKGRVALGSDSGVVNLKGVNSNDFKGLELGIYDNAKCGIKTHNGDSYEYYATDGSLQNITTKIADYIKTNPASASVTAPTELSASASQDTIIAKINELITALITAGIFKNA